MVKSERDELLITDQEPSSVQRDHESFQGVLRRQRRKRQDALCKFCGKPFRNTGSLQNHMLVLQNERPFCCGLCGSRFKSKYTLKEHERIHKGDYRYSCSKCGRGFSQSSHVRDHLKAAHSVIALHPPENKCYMNIILDALMCKLIYLKQTTENSAFLPKDMILNIKEYRSRIWIRCLYGVVGFQKWLCEALVLWFLG